MTKTKNNNKEKKNPRRNNNNSSNNNIMPIGPSIQHCLMILNFGRDVTNRNANCPPKSSIPTIRTSFQPIGFSGTMAP